VGWLCRNNATQKKDNKNPKKVRIRQKVSQSLSLEATCYCLETGKNNAMFLNKERDT
jgi:hypothetical protein